MTLKILKPKVNVTLTLDNEFIQYCKLNDIENIEEFAKEVFKRGFTIIKYGDKPQNITKFSEVIKPVVPVSKETEAIQVPNRYPEADTPIKKKDIYDE